MKRICAWCGTFLGETNGDRELITHGICRACVRSVLERHDESFRSFLDELGLPVLVIDEQGRVQTLNAQAIQVLGPEAAAADNRRTGDVIRCANAGLPSGCGHTLHCQACVIRRAVTDTFATGKGVDREPALQEISGRDGTTRARFLITTQKVNGVVLLRIDDLDRK